MRLKAYLNTRSSLIKRKYRTINVDQELHFFLKKTSINYNIPLSDLIHNILTNWKNEYHDQIMEDIKNRLQ